MAEKEALSKCRVVGELTALALLTAFLGVLVVLPILVFYILDYNKTTTVDNSIIWDNNITDTLVIDVSALRNCTERFYVDNDTGLCVPDCYTWSEYSSTDEVAYFVTDMIIFITVFITGVIFFILSCVRRKKLLKFPTVLNFYLIIDLVLLAFVTSIGIVGGGALFCFSSDLIESLGRPSSICTLSGIISMYLLLQASYWWLAHVGVFFCGVYFPFSYRSWEMSGRINHIHYASVAIGLVAPSIPVIAVMGSYAAEKSYADSDLTFWEGGAGFMPFAIPPVVCAASLKLQFYTIVLIYTITDTVGCVLLFMILWLLRHRNKSNLRVSSSKMKFGKAEIKMLLIFFYYLMLAATFVIYYTYFISNHKQDNQDIYNYFKCEKEGQNDQCDRSELEESAHVYVYIHVVAYLPYSLPLFNIFIFTFNIICLRKCCFTTGAGVTHRKEEGTEMTQE